MDPLGAGSRSAAPGLLRRPLLPLLAAFAAGIALAPRLPAGPWPYLVGAVLALLLILPASRRAPSLLPPLALFLVVGIAAAQATLEPPLPADHISRLHGQRLLVGGRVVAAEERAGGGRRLLVEVYEARGRLLPASGRLLVWASGEGSCPAPGQIVRFPARPRPIRRFANPGCYDIRRRLAADGVFSRTSVPLASISIMGRDDSLGSRLAALRLAVARFFREQLSEPAEGLCLALAAGNRSGLTGEVREAFARAGVAHLLSVSGLHLGLVGLLAYALFRRLVALSERLLLRVPAQYAAAALAFGVVILYAVLVGWRTPAVRAAIMVGAGLVVLLSGRDTDLLSALALAALIILALSPTSLFEPSFQLSFAAVAGIGLVAGKLSRLCQGWRLPRPLSWLVGLLVVSVAATLATAPLVAHHFNQVSLIGCAANLVLVPLVGLALTPLCLAGACLMPLSEGLAALPLMAAEPLARTSLAIVSYLSGLPWAAVWVATPDGCEVALLYGALLALATLRGPRLALALVAVTLAWPLYGRWADGRTNPGGTLIVRYLDVGQGNSALVVLPDGSAMLIDAGGYGSENFDPGRRVIARTLWALRIRELERVALSHSHPDHVAGLRFVLERFRPRQLWVSCPPDPELEQLAETCGCQMVRVRAGQKFELGAVEAQALWPTEEAREGSAGKDWDWENEHSLVLRLAYGRRAFLFPGDIGRSSEMALVESGAPLTSEVLLAPHHGSRLSNSAEFLRAVACQAAVLSRGPGTHRWPSQEVLERFGEAGAQVWRTDTQGMITATSDGEHLALSSFLESP